VGRDGDGAGGIHPAVDLTRTGVNGEWNNIAAIVRRLRAAGATSALHAVPFDPPGPVGHARLRRMVAAGAVRQAGTGYYLDERNYIAWRAVRRKRALVVLAVMVMVIATLVVGGVVKLR
jgi:hypothetical protein